MTDLALTATDEIIQRLTRLEEQVRQLAASVERLAARDAESDGNVHRLSERIADAIAEQNATFQESLKDVTDTFVSREEWFFWRNLMTAALLASLAYAWNLLTH